MTRPRVLLAEDDLELRTALREYLELHGFDVVEFADATGIRDYIEDIVVLDCPRPRAHVLLTDLRMPRMTGLDLLAYSERVGFQLPTVVVTAFGDDETRARAADLGAVAVLDKPIDADALIETLQALVEEAC
ncbi:MAG: response regulator [Sandaracinaceae bacterium]|nr:response regulator [Sandaracinaceae bacterium]